MTSKHTQNTNLANPGPTPPAHFCIYENLNFVADSTITKEHISIGSSRKADVVLSHSAVADIHAFIHFEGAQAFLTNRYPDNGMHLNGQSVHLAKLQNEDVIDVGPYALKVKMGLMDGGANTSGQEQYAIALINRYKSHSDIQSAAVRLSKLFRAEPGKMAMVLAKSQYVIKKELSKEEAERWQVALKKAGIFCEMQEMASAGLATRDSETTTQVDSKDQSGGIGTGHKPIYYIDDEEDDEDLWEARFSLKDKLSKTDSKQRTAMRLKSQLQVVKTSGNRVVDVQFLGKRKKYSIPTPEGVHCLARNKNDEANYVYIGQEFSGYINNAKGETIADIGSYKTSDYLFNKRRQIYRIAVPTTGEIVIGEGQDLYHIYKSPVSSTPAVTVVERPSEFSWKHWAISASTHFILALCLSVYWYFQVVTPKAQGPHFVKIDPTIIQQLQPKKIPDPPKKKPIPKPEPQRMAEKVKPVNKTPPKKRPKKIAKPSKSRKRLKQTAKATPPARHPKAGGGFGEGNIRNRNINQAGLLSVLGKAPAAGQSATIASVTNLDAVAVPGATEKNFSVGGVKGSLGNGKISVASGEMLQTKGSKQVLRSAGVSGPGHVAALEKGRTGKKQVQAMVSAKMSRTVKIRGGMSREMVKRVIDQHLEEITYCYETALMSNPAIMGRIVFEWKILMSGRVGQVRIVASSVNSHEVHNCIKAAIQSWQFPKPTGAEVVVSYPFVFDLVAF